MTWDGGMLSVLIVCDGNVCRSPVAQFVLGARLPMATVESAGVHSLAGSPLCEFVATTIASGQQDAHAFIETFRSRRVRDLDLAQFDLTLAATTELRGDLARTTPSLRDRFFTLREAAVILAAVPDVDGPVDPSVLLHLMNRGRGVTHYLPQRGGLGQGKDALGIEDGHGRRAKGHRAAIELAMGTAAELGDSLARLAVPW